jgi:hypothetical protein
MSRDTVELDTHRGMAAQSATKRRRLVAGAAADQAALRQRQRALEKRLLSRPAANWSEACDKARYLLGLYAASIDGGDARIARLISAVLEDFDRLAARSD